MKIFQKSLSKGHFFTEIQSLRVEFRRSAPHITDILQPQYPPGVRHYTSIILFLAVLGTFYEMNLFRSPFFIHARKQQRFIEKVDSTLLFMTGSCGRKLNLLVNNFYVKCFITFFSRQVRTLIMEQKSVDHHAGYPSPPYLED